MKLTILLLIISISSFAQKSDTTTVERKAKVVPIVLSNMTERMQWIQQAEQKIAEWKAENEKDFTAVLQYNNIAKDSIVKGPSYKDQNFYFRMKKPKK